MKYSIIVPVRNGRGHVENCIESLLSIDYPRDQFQILLIDNQSKDGTIEFVKKKVASVRLLSEEAGASSYSARNLGALHASGEWVLFTDADCVAGCRLIRNYQKSLRVNEVPSWLGGAANAVRLPKSITKLRKTCKRYFGIFHQTLEYHSNLEGCRDSSI